MSDPALDEGTADDRIQWHPGVRMLVMLLLALAVGGTLDLVLDRPTTWRSFHVLYEVGLILAALGTALGLWLGWRRTARDNEALRIRLAAHRADRDAWRASARRALEGLGQAIDGQFTAWGLTPAEREVALGLLKGHSHKQIAGRTGRSERTVRQHAAAAYAKAGLGGRAELSAFFLEGVMLPSADLPPPPRPD